MIPRRFAELLTILFELLRQSRSESDRLICSPPPAREKTTNAFLLLELDEPIDEHDVVDSSCTGICPLREGAGEQLLIAILLDVELESANLNRALDPDFERLAEQTLRGSCCVNIGLRLQRSGLCESISPDCVRQPCFNVVFSRTL